MIAEIQICQSFESQLRLAFDCCRIGAPLRTSDVPEGDHPPVPQDGMIRACADSANMLVSNRPNWGICRPGGWRVLMTRRREFIRLIGGAAAWPLAARAQQARKLPRIGVLISASPPHPFADAFRRGLRALGYTEGQNIAVEFR